MKVRIKTLQEFLDSGWTLGEFTKNLVKPTNLRIINYVGWNTAMHSLFGKTIEVTNTGGNMNIYTGEGWNFNEEMFSTTQVKRVRPIP